MKAGSLDGLQPPVWRLMPRLLVRVESQGRSCWGGGTETAAALLDSVSIFKD